MARFKWWFHLGINEQQRHRQPWHAWDNINEVYRYG